MHLLEHWEELQPYNDYQPTGFDAKGLESERIGPARVLLQQTRDSGCLDQSNFYCSLAMLGGESEFVQVHRFGHWGCGWVELLLILEAAPDEIKETAAEIACSLEDYPILDEGDLSDRECQEAGEYWENMSGDKRIEYIRNNREQFDFTNFSDMLQCCRGVFFNGYASELLQA